jgi:hypothetical protein
MNRQVGFLQAAGFKNTALKRVGVANGEGRVCITLVSLRTRASCFKFFWNYLHKTEDF